MIVLLLLGGVLLIWVIATQLGWFAALRGTPWSWRTLVSPTLQIDWLDREHPDWWRRVR